MSNKNLNQDQNLNENNKEINNKDPNQNKELKTEEQQPQNPNENKGPMENNNVIFEVIYEDVNKKLRSNNKNDFTEYLVSNFVETTENDNDDASIQYE